MSPQVPTTTSVLAAHGLLKGRSISTPLERSPILSELAGADVWLKLECFQRTGSFKLRGAFNKLSRLSVAERIRGIVTCSTGNHALAVAEAARDLGLKAVIVLPENASPGKIAALRHYPVELWRHGAVYDDAERYARQLEQEHGLTFVSPYNDPDIIAGQGTVAVEVFEALPETDVLLVPVGGGGLLAGMALWAKAVRPSCRIFGVQSAASQALHASFRAGHIVNMPEMPGLADGLAGGIEPNALTFPLIQRLVDDILLVREAEIADAIRWLLTEHHIIVEGAGVVGAAALLAGRVPRVGGQIVVAVLTGRNIAMPTLARLLLG